MLRIPARSRHVTREPFAVDAGLVGAPLATFRRRAAAYAVDLLLFGLVVGAFFLALSLWSIHREEPTLLPRLRAAAGGQVSDAERRSATVDLLRLVDSRAPRALPADLSAAITAGRMEEVLDTWGSRDLTLALVSGKTTLTRQDGGWLLQLGTDVLLGRYDTFFGWGAFFVGWFTLLTRLGRGRTPGKWLWGIRVVRLDGRPLGWWDAFGRAGGYGASAATLMLGFLEMIWDPNRQALHDRIAATVVVRGRHGV